jgi:5-methylcytosine-specific restriction endonuclease McrA
MKCKTCDKNCEKEYCFTHKPRKPLSSGKGLSKKASKPQLDKSSLMKQFFMRFWKENKQHVCEVCSKHLGDEPRTYMFDHALEKSKYPELAFEEENIMYLCLGCHDEKTRGHHSDVTTKRIKYLKTKFNIQ